MDAKNGTLIGGIGGAALVAMLLGGPSRVMSGPQPALAPATQISQTPSSNIILRTTLNQSGPWSALCEEFVTGIDDKAASSVVSMDALPKGAEPGASDLTVRNGKFESRLPVHNYPARVNLGLCTQEHAVKTLIATVPDPVRSHMQLEFDRTLAGIVRGAGAADFALQRYWFPWTPSSQQDRQKIPEDQLQLRLRQPGILILRHTEPDKDERLAIFLVSETPTAGVNRVQFANALDYVYQLCNEKSCRVKIAGPRFSASLPILEELIKSYAAKVHGAPTSEMSPYGMFSVYSASTTNGELMTRFVHELPGVDFLTFQIRDTEILNRLVASLQSMSYRAEEIATLSEDESAYGVGQEPNEELNGQGYSEPKPEVNDGANDKPPDLLRLQFPRDLSSIRNAMEEQNPAQEASRQLGVPLASVPLSLHDQPQNEHDSPPPYATQQAAADLDRELQSTVARIRENNIQAVVLMASNPLDRLFLLDYLHRALPDVRLATVESDGLMLRRPGYIDLSGTFIFTGAPLLPDGRAARWRQRWTERKQSTAEEFRSTGEETAFLSVWSLVSPVTVSDVVSPDIHPGAIASLQDCEFMSLVASDRFLLASSKVPEPLYPCTTLRRDVAGITQHLESLPHSWTAFLIVLCFFSICHIFLVSVNAFPRNNDESGNRLWKFAQFLRWELYRVTPKPANAKSNEASDPLGKSDSAAHNARDFGAEKLLLLFVMNNQLLLFAYMASRTTFVIWWGLHAGDLSFTVDKNFIKLALTTACTVALALVSGSAFFALFRRLRTVAKSGIFWQAVIGAAFVIWTARTWEYLLRAGGEAPNWGVAYRSIQILAGLSPLAAIGAILAGYLAWTFTHMRRVEYIQTRKVYLDFQLGPGLESETLDEASAAARRIAIIEKDLHHAIESAVTRPAWGVLIFVVPVLLLLRLNVALRGIDVSRGIFRFSPYSLTIWSVVSGLVALLVFISFSGVQNWRIWTRLRALLQQLNSIPVREVFKEVAADTSSLQIWKIGSNRRSFLLQYRTLEVMRMMEPVVAEQTTQQRTFAASASFDGGTAAITPKSHPTTTITATTTTSTTAGSGPTTATATKTETTIKAASELALSVKPGYHGQLDRLAQTIYESERTETGKTRWMNCSKVPEISRILNLRLAECRPLLVCFDDKDAPQSEKLKAKYLALRFSALIRYSMVQIRNMLWFCLWGYVCLLLSVRLYPFQGRHTLSLLMTIVFMALLLAIGGMFSQMESDPILGRLEDAKNVGESSFLRVAGKLLSVGGVPLLAVLASQFPAFAELVSGWIKPISDALH